jgi:CTP:molybdopterin cytidylyltransferase MocA
VNDTPRMTQHALARCAEMGISTKVAKAIVRNASVNRPSGNAVVATSEEYPDYAVVYYPADPPIVATVVFRTVEIYIRNGGTYVVEEDQCPALPSG